MSHVPLSKHRTQLAAAATLMRRLSADLPVAWQMLQECQPGYPTGGDGGGSGKGGVSDRTGNLATTERPDVARRDLEDLDHLLQRLAVVVCDAADIVRRWQPPSSQWRAALSTEAASGYVETWCRSHLRVQSMEPRRSEGGDLCRWCQDVARDVGADMPPEWIVEKRARGGRITAADIDRARSETKRRRKRR
jgi:hypothetical protein